MCPISITVTVSEKDRKYSKVGSSLELTVTKPEDCNPCSGVYFFANRSTVYVGRSKDVRNRQKSHASKPWWPAMQVAGVITCPHFNQDLRSATEYLLSQWFKDTYTLHNSVWPDYTGTLPLDMERDLFILLQSSGFLVTRKLSVPVPIKDKSVPKTASKIWELYNELVQHVGEDKWFQAVYADKRNTGDCRKKLGRNPQDLYTGAKTSLKTGSWRPGVIPGTVWVYDKNMSGRDIAKTLQWVKAISA